MRVRGFSLYLQEKETDMISDQFKHEVGSYMQRQADKLLAHQASIARASYNTRTGSLARALASRATVKDATVSVPYPVHIRFLDLKKTRSGKKKRIPPVKGHILEAIKTADDPCKEGRQKWRNKQ